MMTTRKCSQAAAIVLFLALAFGPFTPRLAAQATSNLTKDVTYAVPKAPAFKLIGTTPEEISRPSTTRELATSLLSAVDTAGHLVQGFALSVSPALLAVPNLNLTEYQTKTFQRILYNTAISIGTTKAAADSASTQLAVGFQSVLLDRADPMASPAYTKKLAGQFEECVNLDSLAEAKECAREARDAFRKDYLNKTWNAPVVSVGAAWGMEFAESRLDRSRGFGSSYWATAGIPLTQYGQLLGQAQLQTRSDSVEGEYDSFTYGGKLVGGSAAFNAFLELVGQKLRNAPDSVDANTAQWSAGVEFKAGADTWVSTGFGARFNDLTNGDRVFLAAGLRWSVSSGPSFKK